MAVITLHVELKDLGEGRGELRYWRENPHQHQTRNIVIAEIQDLLKQAEKDYNPTNAPEVATVGKRLYRWLDGGDRWLTRELEALQGQCDVVALAISAQHGLANLPWETLHDGTVFLIQAANPPVLPVRWKR